MTQAERIREYYREYPAASCDEVAEVVGTTNSNVRAKPSQRHQGRQMRSLGR